MIEVLTLVFSAIAAFATLAFGFANGRRERRGERRAVEARDVLWHAKRTAEGFSFSHAGSTVARDVRVSLTVDGDTSNATADEVMGGASIVVANDNAQRLARESAAEDAEYERALKEYESPTETDSAPVWMPAPPIIRVPPMPPMGRSVQVSAIIAWRYPSGASGRQELLWRESY